MKQYFLVTAAIAVFALVGNGCGMSPLVAHWSRTGTAGGADLTSTMALNADGSASFTIVGMGTCMGMLTYAGLTWSSGSTLTFGGMPTCSGMVMCTISGTPVNIDCSASASMGPQNGQCMYTLSNNDDTLTVGPCEGTVPGTATYTRASN